MLTSRYRCCADAVSGRLLVFEEYELPDGSVVKVQGELPPPPEEGEGEGEGGAEGEGDEDDDALFPPEEDEVEQQGGSTAAQEDKQ
jgi:hypothetical protein